MSKSKDPLALRPHWHVDYRIEAELPDDTVIGTRFLINLAFSGTALATLLLAGWFSYMTWNLSNQIRDWERRIDDNKAEVTAIQAVQTEFTIESIKIDQAYAIVGQPFLVSDLVANLGRTRQDQMAIDLIEWNDSGVVLRGGLREKGERASRLLGTYENVLRKDEKIGPLFQAIRLTDIDRGAGGDFLRFEIKFTLKDRK